LNGGRGGGGGGLLTCKNVEAGAAGRSLAFESSNINVNTSAIAKILKYFMLRKLSELIKLQRKYSYNV